MEDTMYITSNIDKNFRNAFCMIDKDTATPLNNFYIKVTEKDYSTIESIAHKMGCSLQGDEQFFYDYVLFNLSEEGAEDLEPKSFWFTERDLHDGIPVIPMADLRNYYAFIDSAKEGTEEMSFSYGENILEKHWEEKAKKLEGVKFSGDKAPMATMLRQFPLSLEAVAFRSKVGHEKYKESDHDWMNFKRVPNAIEQYSNASVRHLAGIGEDEDDLGHLKAAAWNILASLQLILEEKNDKINSTTL